MRDINEYIVACKVSILVMMFDMSASELFG